MEQLEHHLEDLYSDLALRPAVVIFWWRAVTWLRGTYQLQSESDDVELELPPVHRCLDALSPSSIATPDQFRWEVDVAAALAHRSRVVRLLREWQSRGMPMSYLAIAVRALFLLCLPTGDTRPPSGTWDPDLCFPGAEQLYRGYSRLAWACAIDVPLIRVPSKLDRPARLRDDIDRASVRELRNLVNAAKDAGTLAEPEALAVQAWSIYSIGLLDARPEECERAGALYEAVPDVVLPNSTSVSNRWKRWQAATLAYQDAGLIEPALRTARIWAGLSSERPLVYRTIAELCWKLGRLEDAMQAFEKAIGDESGERDWQDSLILSLGLDKLQGDTVSRAITHAASASPFKEQGRELVAWIMPWFTELGEKARDRLWFGLYALSSPSIKADTGQAAWDNAGDSFGEALAFELKRVVFIPFFQEHSDLVVSGEWEQIRAGRGTLGQLVEAVLQCREQPNHTTAKKLRAWLDSRRPGFIDVVSRNAQRLKRAYRLRGSAQHDSIKPVEVRELFDTAVVILAALHSRPPVRN